METVSETEKHKAYTRGLIHGGLSVTFLGVAFPLLANIFGGMNADLRESDRQVYEANLAHGMQMAKQQAEQQCELSKQEAIKTELVKSKRQTLEVSRLAQTVFGRPAVAFAEDIESPVYSLVIFDQDSKGRFQEIPCNATFITMQEITVNGDCPALPKNTALANRRPTPTAAHNGLKIPQQADAAVIHLNNAAGSRSGSTR